MKAPESYVAGIERRHNMSAETRSCGEHCPHPFEVTDVGPMEKVPITSHDAPGGRRGGRESYSNDGPQKRV